MTKMAQPKTCPICFRWRTEVPKMEPQLLEMGKCSGCGKRMCYSCWQTHQGPCTNYANIGKPVKDRFIKEEV